MARIRTIKPEFWEDEKIGILSHGARLLFIGCFNLSDDEGLLRWNEMYLGSSIFPYDSIKADTIIKWMNELTDNELVYVYQAGVLKQKIGYIINFHKHQRIDKPQPSKFPAPNYRDVRFKKVIANRDRWICHICNELIIENDSIKKIGSKALSLDHIKPQKLGGTSYPSNLKASHLSCNHIKSGSYEMPYSENDSENDYQNHSDNDSTQERKGKGKEWNGSRNEQQEILKNENPEFLKAINDWLDYKKSRRESYKNQKSINAFVSKLKNLSGGDPFIARKIIDESMANNWAGIFELKISPNGANSRHFPKSDRTRQLAIEAAEDLAQRMASSQTESC